jgi:hypothetical protein
VMKTGCTAALNSCLCQQVRDAKFVCVTASITRARLTTDVHSRFTIELQIVQEDIVMLHCGIKI